MALYPTSLILRPGQDLSGYKLSKTQLPRSSKVISSVTMKGEGKERCVMKVPEQTARQTHFLTKLQDRPISLPVEVCSSLSLSRLCSCGYHSCELCLLGCYQSSVPTHSAKFRDNLFFPAWLFAVGRRREGKSSEKNTLRENGREGNGVSVTLHPPS